jgi:hypothetical protein
MGLLEEAIAAFYLGLRHQRPILPDLGVSAILGEIEVYIS